MTCEVDRLMIRLDRWINIWMYFWMDEIANEWIKKYKIDASKEMNEWACRLENKLNRNTEKEKIDNTKI